MELSLEKIFKIIWKNIVVITVVSIIFGGASFAVSKFIIPKTYVSRIGFTVISTASETNVANPSYLNSNLNYTREIVRSKIAMLNTYDYYSMVASQLNSDIDSYIAQHPEKAQELEQSKKNPAQIDSAVSFSLVDNTELFTVTVRTNSPGESQMIAEAIGKTANVRLTQLAMPDNSLAGHTPVTDTVRCYEKPLYGSLAGPNVLSNTLMGAMLGFALTFSIFFIITIKDTRVKNINEFTEKYKDIPVLGTVVSFKTAKK